MRSTLTAVSSRAMAEPTRLLPARFCLHQNPPAADGGARQPADHIDLFVLPEPEAALLWTFELPREFADTLSTMADAVRERNVQVMLRALDESGALHSVWPTVRKADHRRVYWTHTGTIAPGPGQQATRGTLLELARGQVDWPESGPPTAGQPLGLWLSENSD